MSASEASSPASARPGVLIAATHSGAGKTTIASVVSRALRRRGLEVAPFKLGPDFIDPGYHAESAGRRSINLDVWMMGEDGVRRSYRRWSHGADIAVIEAMGALYDGQDGSEHGSAAHVAKLLHVPVVVVLDVWGMTRTTAAILDGLRAFDPAVDIAGCVLNRVGSTKHAEMVIDSLPPQLRRLVVGAIERDPQLEIPERHLGLVTVEENQAARKARGDAQARAGGLLDIDRLVQIAGTGRRPASTSAGVPRMKPVARLAVARDKAFHFYYEENLLLLREGGFELVPFSPIADQGLPADVDAVYIGGGYPEVFATYLEANTSLAAELRERAADGTPIHAECGGLIYLARTLTGFDGRRHAMTGVLPIDIVMDHAHLVIRYVEARTPRASPVGPAGTTIRGQEFHQSRIAAADVTPTLYDLTTSDGQTHRAGYHHGNITASYVPSTSTSHRTPTWSTPSSDRRSKHDQRRRK